MDAPNLLVRQGTVNHVAMSVLRLPDRRANADATTDDVEWAVQFQLERALYGSGYGRSTGAVYRLLQRSGVGHRALALKRGSIAEGLVTEAEWSWLYSHLVDVRSVTLVPLDAVSTALIRFGQDERSEAVVTTLGIERPFEWDSDDDDDGEGEEAAGQEEGEEAGEEDEEDGEDEEDDEDGEEQESEEEAGEESEESEKESEDTSEDADDDGASGGASSGGAGGSVAGEGAASTGAYDGSDSDAPPTEPDANPADVDNLTIGERVSAKRGKKYALTPTPQLESELAAFAIWRAAPMNRSRSSAAVVAATVQSDVERILRLMGWLDAIGKLPSTPSLGIFASANISAVVQRFVTVLTTDNGCMYSTAAKHLGSFVLAARYAATRAPKACADVVPELESLQKQAKRQAAQAAKFAASKEDFHTASLSWDAVLAARVAAEKVYHAYKGGDVKVKLALTRSVLLMRLHSDSPPDRVRVWRELKLGTTLRRCEDGSGYDLNLTAPGLHKSSAVFGPSCTQLHASVVPWLDAWIKLTGIADGEFVFTAKDGVKPHSPSQWTRLVQRVYRKHAGVAIAPKDLRSMYITFLKSGDHGDELLKATALSMRHSSKMQDSAAYNKSNKIAQTAVAAAGSYSDRFIA